jgi:hypothetical protein
MASTKNQKSGTKVVGGVSVQQYRNIINKRLKTSQQSIQQPEPRNEQHEYPNVPELFYTLEEESQAQLLDITFSLDEYIFGKVSDEDLPIF